MKKGAVASGALAIGGSGVVAGQEGDDTDTDGDDGGIGDLDDNWKGLVFASNFHPNARFTFVSDVVEWTPNYGDVRDSFFSDYNTYQIRWVNTDEVVPLFVAEDASIGEYDDDLGFITDADDDENQPQVFEMNREWTPFGDNDRLITINAGPVGEDTEDAILENQDWWKESEDEGTATQTENAN